MQSELGARPADSANGVKKRKVRKGTHSCWECKSGLRIQPLDIL